MVEGSICGRARGMVGERNGVKASTLRRNTSAASKTLEMDSDTLGKYSEGVCNATAEGWKCFVSLP